MPKRKYRIVKLPRGKRVAGCRYQVQKFYPDFLDGTWMTAHNGYTHTLKKALKVIAEDQQPEPEPDVIYEENK